MQESISSRLQKGAQKLEKNLLIFERSVATRGTHGAGK